MKILCLALLLASCGQQSTGGGGGGAPPDESPARKERLLTNLQHELPQLQRFQPKIGEIKRGTHGLDEIKLMIAGPQGINEQLILATPDDKVVYLVARGPIDASRSADDILRDEKKKHDELATSLKDATSGKPVRGNPSAPVTVVEFSDFQCPYCRRGAETVEQLLAKYPQDVRLVFMHYPLPFHEWAKPAAVAVECAAQQNPEAFWKLHDAYFAAQDQFTPENVLDKSQDIVAKAGVDVKQWSACARDTASEAHKKAAENVDKAMAAGEKFGVEGTPAFFINGEMVGGAVPLEELDAKVQSALKRRG